MPGSNAASWTLNRYKLLPIQVIYFHSGILRPHTAVRLCNFERYQCYGSALSALKFSSSIFCGANKLLWRKAPSWQGLPASLSQFPARGRF